MDEMLDWDECPGRVNDPSGDTRHELDSRCTCRHCGDAFHKWNGCVCSTCGETRHVFIEYYNCPICGKRVDKYHAICHALHSEPVQKFDCKCIRCYIVVHDFQNHKCTRCFKLEEYEHEHISDGRYKLRFTEDKLYYDFSCSVCIKKFVQEHKPALAKVRAWDHQPFVFRNGMKAFVARELIELCYQFPEDGIYHLLEGHFEPWLDYIGERNLTVFCMELRTQNGESSPRQKLDALIAEFCYQDNKVIESDGQSWVAGWD